MALVTLTQFKDYMGITGSSEDTRLTFMIDGADAALKAKAGIDIERTVYPGAAANGVGDSGLYNGDNSRFLFLRQPPVNLNTLTGNTTNGSASVTSLSSTTYLFVGQGITGSGIPDGTTISAISGTTLTLSKNATATATGVALSAGIAVWEDLTGYFGVGPSAFASTTLLADGVDYIWHRDGCLPGTSTKCGYEGRLERLNTVWRGVRVRHDVNLIRGPGPTPGSVKVGYVGGFPSVPGDLILGVFELIAWLRKTYLSGGTLDSEKFEDYQYVRGKSSQYLQQVGTIMNIIGRYKRRMVA